MFAPRNKAIRYNFPSTKPILAISQLKNIALIGMKYWPILRCWYFANIGKKFLAYIKPILYKYFQYNANIVQISQFKLKIFPMKRQYYPTVNFTSEIFPVKRQYCPTVNFTLQIFPMKSLYCLNIGLMALN